MLEVAREWIAVISGVIGILAVGIPMLIAWLKKAKELIKERNWSMLIAQIPELVIAAEQFANYKGAEKLNYVTTRLIAFAADNNIKIDEALLTVQIKEVVDMTKKVNTKNKNEEE